VTVDPRTPILVGGGQFTQRTAREGRVTESLSPIGMLAKASRMAFADTGTGDALARTIDTVAVVRFASDTPDPRRAGKRFYRNPPASLANAIGANPRRQLYSMVGGNTPQWLVNRTAEEITRGECEVALLAGQEDLASLRAAMKSGVPPDWHDDPGSDPEEIGDPRFGVTDHEWKHGITQPTNIYPLFENALRGQAGRTPSEHLKWMGEFFSPFSKVASENPHAWFPTFRSPQEISTPSEKNRFVGYPYTKYLNAVIDVDMAAAVVMTSVAKARELGIAESKWVFLHGCADASDLWWVSQRVNYHSSPAIHAVGKHAFAMAGKSVDDLSFIDLYSCFPSAVEIGCQELGIATNDPRGLTITGGLPYFGGAGNNYVMHSIVMMMQKLRAAPGTFGLCTGNGWYVTKHSAGIYSTTPTRGAWQREDPKLYQKDLDAMAHPELIERPEGRATVETYTVVAGRDRRIGIIVGRDARNRRFLANTSDDDATLDWMMREDILGKPGEVVPGERNLFRFL
jgi:acetyl-CoA C-acetyltransferase